ncbi:MAG: hypothetical protein Q4A12_05935 [Eubacteriales bacterium]|nr:hypothetical protein [Eubacteriales bacterium]
MINYFYNIIIKEDDCDFYSDVLTSIRKDYYLSKEKQKGKITQNSSGDTVFYEFALEKGKSLKWEVSNNDVILSESKRLDEGKYSVTYYGEGNITRILTFSKYHTLLKVEYFDLSVSSLPYCSLEPRKNNDDLCLLMTKKSSYGATILYPMPSVDDEYIQDKVDVEFVDYFAVASTNAGVVKFLSDDQLEKFNDFVDKANELKAVETAPKSYIEENEAYLAQKLNPKDFNVKKNLFEAIDITKAQEFVVDIEDEFLGFNIDDEVEEETIDTPEVQEVAEKTAEQSEVAESVEQPQQQAKQSSGYKSMFDNFDEITVVNTAATYNAQEDVIIEDTTVVDNTETDVELSVEPQDEPATITEETEEILQVDEEIKPSALESETQFETDITAVATTETVEDETPDLVIDRSNTKYLYFGEVDESGKRNGYGRTATENKRTAYEGNYVDNKRNGLGAYYYKDGSLCYYGEWKNNMRDGVGIGVSSFDKSVHIGNFTNNKPVGDGVRINSDGEVNFIKKTLSNGHTVLLKFDCDKIIVTKYNEKGEVISENSSNLMYF